MFTLGAVILWAGYTGFIWGLTMFKATRNPSLSLSLPDLVLPSHRAQYLLKVGQWPSSPVTQIPTSVGANGINSIGGTATASNPEGPPAPATPPKPGGTNRTIFK